MDDLDGKRNQLDSQLEVQKSVVEGVSKELTDAVDVLEAAKTELATTGTVLSKVETKLTIVKGLDTQHVPKLVAVETKAKRARADVAAAEAAYDPVGVRISEKIMVITQQNDGLAELSVLFSGADVGNVNQRARLADTLFSSSVLELDELISRRSQPGAAKKEVDEAEAAAVEARKAAAGQLKSSRRTGGAAKTRRVKVAEKVVQYDAAKVKADSQLTTEKGRQSESKNESSEVDRRIQGHITQRERAEEERQTRERPYQRGGSSPSSSSLGSDSSSSSGGGSSSSGGFVYPVDSAVGSPHGIWVHPVPGYSKLHNGTDFATGCGTSICAAGDDMASERYFNAGYRSRLMIDRDSKGGTYVTTGCNHVTGYVISVGDRVSQGQIIGYVGTTGYSTGCHLHLMIWESGSVTSPVSRWFS